jgi:Probable Zinc-ribbon domain/ROS/MUCR transcriptional regulator protein
MIRGRWHADARRRAGRSGLSPTVRPITPRSGELRHDGDRVQCHLCGRWFKMVGGSHTISAHDMTVAEYRGLFRLNGNVSTVAPETAERKRETMLAQIASGERDQSVLGQPSPPTVPSWRSLTVLHPQLMDEWHPTRNRDLDPYNVGQCSRLKIWWRCRECGHKRQATPHDRAFSGRGCPACARRRRIAATIERNRRAEVRPERTLAVVCPQLLQEWHPTRNRELDPLMIAAPSERIVWWRCSVDRCGREWRAMLGSRTKHGTLGCPRCAHRLAGQRRARADPGQSFGALHPIATLRAPTQRQAGGHEPKADQPPHRPLHHRHRVGTESPGCRSVASPARGARPRGARRSLPCLLDDHQR